MNRRPILMAVGVVVVGIFLVLLLWKIPEWQTPSGITDLAERAHLQNELRRTIAQIALGLLVLGTLFVGWRRVRAADRTVEIAREQQITERFTRAIDQLGNEQGMAIRLGGIYALERIAKDSPKDHWQVMEVLTAYVRENARREWGKDEHGIQASGGWRMPTDIQAILTVLGRRNAGIEAEGQFLDLQDTDLRRANLQGANFQKGVLRRANLQEALLESANLQEASLLFANLEGASLSNTNLQRATLSFANLQGTYLTEANLLRTNLRGANLSGAEDLTPEQIASAIIDENTVLPDYLKKDQAGS